jgi:hypothetical protein
MFATLGFTELVRVPPGMEAQFPALRLWLDSWKGIGDIVAVSQQAVSPELPTLR